MKRIIAFVLLSFPLLVMATFQIPDTLLFNGKKYLIEGFDMGRYGSPVEDYFLMTEKTWPFNGDTGGICQRRIP